TLHQWSGWRRRGQEIFPRGCWRSFYPDGSELDTQPSSDFRILRPYNTKMSSYPACEIQFGFCTKNNKPMKRKLANIAHGRAGDKGNTLVLSLFPLREENYGLLVKQVTAEKVRELLAHQLKGEVTRHVLPELKGILVTCENALSSGVTTSIA